MSSAKRSPQNPRGKSDRTEAAVKGQLLAMAAVLYDIGLREEKTGRFMYRRDLSGADVLGMVKWLRHMNMRGNHIYIRPAGERHHLVLLDDLEPKIIERMKNDGRKPTAVIETSPENCQAWLKISGRLGPEDRRSIARALAEEYGGNPSSTDSAHLGRLAGFTNRKPEYRTSKGLFPFSLLVEASGYVCTNLPNPPPEESERPPFPAQGAGAVCGTVKSIEECQQDPRYAGDLHRADMAWACQAASVGMSREEIVVEILNGRDLQKKGSEQRQREYAERTAEKAIVQDVRPQQR